MKKTTDELLNILKETKDIEHYIADNSPEFISDTLQKHISELLSRKDLTVATAARRGQLSESYLYKINQGVKKNISRDKMIQICFGLGLDAKESSRLLKIAGVSELYPRIRLDSILMTLAKSPLYSFSCKKLPPVIGDRQSIHQNRGSARSGSGLLYKDISLE